MIPPVKERAFRHWYLFPKSNQEIAEEVEASLKEHYGEQRYAQFLKWCEQATKNGVEYKEAFTHLRTIKPEQRGWYRPGSAAAPGIKHSVVNGKLISVPSCQEPKNPKSRSPQKRKSR